MTELKSNTHTELSETQLLEAIQQDFIDIECVFDERRRKGRGYYLNTCFHIYAFTSSGTEIELVDGCDVNWTQILLSNARERLVISGIGSERLCAEFGNNNMT